MKQRDLSGIRRCSSSESEQTGEAATREGVATVDRLNRSVDAKSRRAGVRGVIVASKPGNAGGAKGSREMDS
jgi:hypothetical protein